MHVRLLDGEQRPLARQVLASTVDETVHLAADPLALSVLLAAPADPIDVAQLVGLTLTRLAEAGVGVITRL